MMSGDSCLKCGTECGCGNIWVTVATGANYPDFDFIGSVLQDARFYVAHKT